LSRTRFIQGVKRTYGGGLLFHVYAERPFKGKMRRVIGKKKKVPAVPPPARPPKRRAEDWMGPPGGVPDWALKDEARGRERRKASKKWPPKTRKCSCAVVAYNDWRYIRFRKSQKLLWAAALKKRKMSPYDLWMKESMFATRKYWRFPTVPTESGGYCVPYIQNGGHREVWQCRQLLAPVATVRIAGNYDVGFRHEIEFTLNVKVPVRNNPEDRVWAMWEGFPGSGFYIIRGWYPFPSRIVSEPMWVVCAPTGVINIDLGPKDPMHVGAVLELGVNRLELGPLPD